MRTYRHELKFFISKNMAEILKYRLGLIMDIDTNSVNQDHTYFIRSLYFDNQASNAYYEKLNGVEHRKKYRIRLYNFDESFIRLERKLKDNQMTSKDQMKIDKQTCEQLLDGNYEALETNENNLLQQFILECKIEHLFPSVIVDYKRLAYTYPISDVRITFDEQIKSGLYHYDLFDHTIPTYDMFLEDELVLEVKFNEILPSHIASVLATVPMCRQAVSKFAICRSVK